MTRFSGPPDELLDSALRLMQWSIIKSKRARRVTIVKRVRKNFADRGDNLLLSRKRDSR